jgi:putative transposase
MKDLYHFLGISKQAHWKYMRNHENDLKDRYLLSRGILHLRQLHPKMGAKKMYLVLKPEFLGRDAFIELYSELELKLKRERSFTRTTFSTPGAKYKNLTRDKSFNDIDQLWSSDITYFSIGVDSFLYITFIMDVYSRKILGYSVSNDLSAEASMAALRMALNYRNIKRYDNLIHHSDKGTQYTSIAYTNLLTKFNIQVSMCDSVYENTHIERVNGIFKNEYLAHLNIRNLAECQRTLTKAVQLYNTVRPHWGLNGLTPDCFESKLKNTPLSERINLQIYQEANRVNCQNVKQFEIPF